jgi:hypothetical protein
VDGGGIGGVGLNGIWIKSQDKRRLKFVDEILLRDIEKPAAHSDNPFDFVYDHTEVNARSNDCEFTLGYYKSEERALQVLDEIQGHIWESVRAVTFPNDGYVAPIYEMPQA